MADAARRLWPLWLIVAISALPISAAWLFWLHPAWIPAGTLNRGELVAPPRPLGLNAGGGGGWTLLTVAWNGCDAHCRARVHDLRQIRKAMAAEQRRVERVLLLFDPLPPEQGRVIDAAYRGTRIELAQPRQRDAFAAGLGARCSGCLYLIDPFGRLVLRYRADAPARDVVADLNLLLKATRDPGDPKAAPGHTG